jgi:hypothetical protein
MWAEVEDLRVSRDRAIVEIIPRGDRVTASGIEIVKLGRTKDYDPFDDYEMAILRQIGEGGGFEPAEVGDVVIIRAPSGGAAGADIGLSMGRNRGEIVVVEREEIVCVAGRS